MSNNINITDLPPEILYLVYNELQSIHSTRIIGEIKSVQGIIPEYVFVIKVKIGDNNIFKWADAGVSPYENTVDFTRSNKKEYVKLEHFINMMEAIRNNEEYRIVILGKMKLVSDNNIFEIIHHNKIIKFKVCNFVSGNMEVTIPVNNGTVRDFEQLANKLVEYSKLVKLDN